MDSDGTSYGLQAYPVGTSMGISMGSRECNGTVSHGNLLEEDASGPIGLLQWGVLSAPTESPVTTPIGCLLCRVP